MTRSRYITILACSLAACAGPTVGGQSTAAQTIGDVRPNIYEIAPEQLADETDPAFIEVSGAATVEVPADQASVSFAVESRAGAADEAAAANATVMDRVLAALRAGGFEGLDLRTFGYQLQPQYATDNARVRTIVAYVAVNNVGATLSSPTLKRSAA